jgi:hypothetical protein
MNKITVIFGSLFVIAIVTVVILIATGVIDLSSLFGSTTKTPGSSAKTPGPSTTTGSSTTPGPSATTPGPSATTPGPSPTTHGTITTTKFNPVTPGQGLKVGRFTNVSVSPFSLDGSGSPIIQSTGSGALFTVIVDSTKQVTSAVLTNDGGSNYKQGDVLMLLVDSDPDLGQIPSPAYIDLTGTKSN